MRLYLVQHGNASSKEVSPERPLTEAGQRDIQRLAKYLNSLGVLVERVLNSGKPRARHTAEILGAAVAPDALVEDVVGMEPNDSPTRFSQQIEDLSSDVLIVGHQPFMGGLVSHLVVGDPALSIVEFRPGSSICLNRNDEDHWVIAWMVRPELLA